MLDAGGSFVTAYTQYIDSYDIFLGHFIVFRALRVEYDQEVQRGLPLKYIPYTAAAAAAATVFRVKQAS